MAWRERAVIKVKRLKDFLDHVDRADRVYFHQRGAYVVAFAANMVWEGNVDTEPKELQDRLKQVLAYKGVEVADIMDTFETVDYLKAVIRG